MMKIYDVSVLLSDKLPTWPGDPPLKMSLASSIARGDVANVTHLDMGAHNGTHMDAPFHFEANGTGIEQLSLGNSRGSSCRVFDLTEVTGQHHGSGVGEMRLAKVTRMLFKTRNSRHWAVRTNTNSTSEFTALAADSAAHLIEKGSGVGWGLITCRWRRSAVRSIPAHEILLGMSAGIVEGLNLFEVLPGRL